MTPAPAFRPRRAPARWRRLAAHAPRGLLVLVWAVAGLTKALGPHRFELDIARFQLFPAFLLPWGPGLLARSLPYLELCCAAGLLTSRARAGALFWSTTLLAGFSLALGSAWARGISLDCGCFGHPEALGLSSGAGSWASSPPVALARNALLLVACGWEWRREGGRAARGSGEAKRAARPDENASCSDEPTLP